MPLITQDKTFQEIERTAKEEELRRQTRIAFMSLLMSKRVNM